MLKARSLTDDEVDLCRLWALGGGGDHRLALVWALAEASARPSGIPLEGSSHESLRNAEGNAKRCFSRFANFADRRGRR
jgi:hypothetical protein